jgi:recombination protein RecA
MAKSSKSSQDQSVTKSALTLAMEKIEKDYGKGTMLYDKNRKRDIISTGSLKLDIATGIGGLARGTVVEFIGWESSGKSTTTLNIIRDAQKQGLKCLLVDGEHALDAGYAQKLGVDLDPTKLIVYQPDGGGGEKAYDIAERLIKTGEIAVVVFDSQTILLPKKIFDDPNEASNLGLHARLMSRVVPKMETYAGTYNVLVIFISQLREKIGVMYGNPETTNGGNALRMYAHMRLEFRKSVLSDDAKNAYANKTTVKIIKNKLAPPFKKVDFHLIFNEGVDRVREIFDLAIEYDIITQAGSWYSYKDTKLGQGEDSVLQLLKDNPGYASNLEELVLKTIKEQSNESGRSGESCVEVVSESDDNADAGESEQTTRLLDESISRRSDTQEGDNLQTILPVDFITSDTSSNSSSFIINDNISPSENSQ